MELTPLQRDSRSAGFFDAAAEGRLAVRSCRSCGHLFAPELTACTRCWSADSAWQTVSGDATVLSWVVVHGRTGSDRPAPPSPVVLVELVEGPWMTVPAELATVNAPGFEAGSPVTVSFVQPEHSEPIPICIPRP